jgi:LysM repeat protein
VDQIAAKYGVSSAQILSANPNVNFGALRRGTSINIPRAQ